MPTIAIVKLLIAHYRTEFGIICTVDFPKQCKLALAHYWNLKRLPLRVKEVNVCVSICSGCYNKILETECLKHLGFTVLEAGKSKVKVPSGPMSGEGPLFDS